MDYFGGRNVSGIIGVLYTSVAFGTLIGPSAGFTFDLSHSYALPIVASVCANIMAAGIMVGMSKATVPISNVADKNEGRRRHNRRSSAYWME